MKSMNWVRTLFAFDRRQAPWVIAVLAAGVMAWYWDRKTPTGEGDPHKAESIEAADTYIPQGFVLVPIEVANFDSLDSILGKYGIVDLYSSSSTLDSGHESRPKKVADHVKILRAPLNPSHFAVLVSEAQSPDLVRYAGAFTVVVQNPRNIANQATSIAQESASVETNSQLSERASQLAKQHRGKRPSRITVEIPDDAE